MLRQGVSRIIRTAAMAVAMAESSVNELAGATQVLGAAMAGAMAE